MSYKPYKPIIIKSHTNFNVGDLIILTRELYIYNKSSASVAMSVAMRKPEQIMLENSTPIQLVDLKDVAMILSIHDFITNVGTLTEVLLITSSNKIGWYSFTSSGLLAFKHV